MKYVICLLLIIAVLSIMKFQRQFEIDLMMSDFTRDCYKSKPGKQTAVEYGCALMQVQMYKSAVEVFNDAKKYGSLKAYPYVKKNIAFCEKPLSWSRRGAKDRYVLNWWRDILVSIFGKERVIVYSDKTLDEFNKYLSDKKCC